MSNSVNYSDIIAQIQQRCRIEGRQPTLEDYNDVISFLQQTSLHFQQENAQLQLKNSHLLQHYTHLMQANEICKVKCTHLSEDNKISQEILLRKHLEVIFSTFVYIMEFFHILYVCVAVSVAVK